MFRDVSDIHADWGEPLTFDAWCYQDDQTILVYKDDGTSSGIGHLTTYKLIADKYIRIGDNTSEPSAPIPTNCVNQTVGSIDTIPSRYDFMSPIYQEMAIVSAILIIVIAFRIIIYPFLAFGISPRHNPAHKRIRGKIGGRNILLGRPYLKITG